MLTLTEVDPRPTVLLIPSSIKLPTPQPRPDGHGFRIRQQLDGVRRQWNGATPDAVQWAWIRELHPELLPSSGPSRTDSGRRPRTVGELLDGYFVWLGKQTRIDKFSPKTYETYAGAARRLLRTCPIRDPHDPSGRRTLQLGAIGLEELTPAMVDEMSYWLRTQAPNRRRAEGGLSASQTAQALTVLGAAYTWLRTKQRVPVESPVHDAEKVVGASSQALTIPTPAQVRHFLEYVERKGDPLAAYWRSAFTLGMRGSELSAIGLSRLIGAEGDNLPRQVRVWLQVQLIKDPDLGTNVWHERDPKQHSRRVLGLSARTAQALVDAALATQARRRRHSEWDERWDDLVFRRRDGTPYPVSEISSLFSERLRRAGLPHWNFHLATRHFAASAWIAAGATTFEVARRLGHRDTTTVEHTYGHLFEVVDPRSAAQMEQVLAEWLPSTATL